MFLDKHVMLLLETSSTFDRGILRGVAKYARMNGNWSVMMDPPFYRDMIHPSAVAKKIKSSHTTGIILREPGVYLRQERPLRAIIELQIPTIILTSVSECVECDCMLRTDNAAIGIVAAEYFLEKGFQNFGYCGFNNLAWSRQRKESFFQRISARSLEVYDYERSAGRAWVFSEKEKTAMIKWLKSIPKPIGMLVCNDRRGQQVIEACRDAKILVPQDVAVIGVDNDDCACDLSAPSLSSIALNTEIAGYEAACLLDKLMTNPRRKTRKVITVKPVSVIERNSTDIIAIDNPDIRRAISFIRLNWKKPLQVSDVAEATGVSRRLLQQKFREKLSFSIHDEITRVRIDKAAQMLRETHLSVSRIALELGFSTDRHLIRTFQKQMKTSPGKYRNKFLDNK